MRRATAKAFGLAIPQSLLVRADGVINMKTAKALDLTIPQFVLLRGDEAIQ